MVKRAQVAECMSMHVCTTLRAARAAIPADGRGFRFKVDCIALQASISEVLFHVV